MLGFIRQGLEDFSVSREKAPWGIPFPIMPDGSSSQLPDGSWNPDAGTVYVWFDALTNYVTGVGFPDEPDRFAGWWPADLHIIGKDINRLHTIMWPAMLMSAGLPLPREVWVHGWLLVQGERMSKSRGNFLDPIDVVAALGTDGARYVLLREVAFDRDSDVSWDSFVRRYNADLANDFGNLVNRSVSMTARYLGGERPAPRPRSRRRSPWRGARRARRTGEALGLPPARRAGRPLGLRRGGQPVRRRRAAVGAGKGGPGRRRRPHGRGCATSWATSSRRAGSSGSPRRRSSRTSPRAWRSSSGCRIRTAPTGTAVRRSTSSCAGERPGGRPHRRPPRSSRAWKPRPSCDDDRSRAREPGPGLNPRAAVPDPMRLGRLARRTSRPSRSPATSPRCWPRRRWPASSACSCRAGTSNRRGGGGAGGRIAGAVPAAPRRGGGDPPARGIERGRSNLVRGAGPRRVPGRRRHRRDRARLRPRVLAARRAAGEPAPPPRARSLPRASR